MTRLRADREPSRVRLFTGALAAVVALALAGCQPEIGDACATALDCSSLGERLCDVTMPGGYCTQFNCAPGSCPDEAACILFRNDVDAACQGVDDGKSARFSQAFCMVECDDVSDCRAGYACLAPSERGARAVDKDEDGAPVVVRICVPASTPAELPSEPPGVCSPGAAPPLVPYVPTTGTTSATGAGGAGGAEGVGGSGVGGG